MANLIQPQSPSTSSDVPFACDLSVFTPEERANLERISAELFAAVTEIRELADGYAYRLPQTFPVMTVAEFILYDHRCCPFFNHGMDVEPRGGSIWLRLTGHDGIKPFIIAEIGDNHLLRDEVAAAAGWNQPG